MTIKLCLAGATGWAGSTLARAIAQTEDIELVSAVSRTQAGRILGNVLGEPRLTAPIYGTVEEALDFPCDVFFEYTKPDVARSNVMTALDRGANVVIGTSGLTDNEYAVIAAVAKSRERGVLAVGNFALTAVLLMKFAEMAAKLIPQWEIIDYASDRKKDAPIFMTWGYSADTLSIRHDSGTSAEPYVAGALLAIRKAGSFVGLRRGLDSVLDI